MRSEAISLEMRSPAGQNGGGRLIVNADDWGRDCLTTDRIFDCVRCGTVTSVSAMVFMEDSARAAALASEHKIEAGLHINLTTAFTAPAPSGLLQHQENVGRYLLRHRLCQAVFHPGLRWSFKYLVAAQIDEFTRLYGAAPRKLDGHHHMHLSENVLAQELLPAGAMVRRNFTFERGEKSLFNRLYRKLLDRRLAKRHWTTDLFYALPPIEPARVEKIYALARHFVVELETHPAVPEEYRYLTGAEMLRQTAGIRITPALR